MQRLGVLLFGRIGFSVYLLNNAPDIDEDARVGMARNLGCLLCIITDEDMYFYVLIMELPAIYFLSHKLDKPWFHCMRKALKTLLIVSSSRHSLCAIDSFLIKVLVQSHFLYCVIVPPTTFQLLLPGTYDSIWVAKADTRKKEYNGGHSWDYTLLPAKQLIWNPTAGIDHVCELLQLVHYFLMIRISTQNILSNTRCFSVAMCFDVFDYGSSNHSTLSRITLDIHGALQLHHFPYASGATLYVITLGGTVLVICVRDPGINSKTMNLNDYTETLEAQLLLESTCKFCLCAYSDSINKVWDPDRRECIDFYILQFDFVFEFARSLCFINSYNGERPISSHSTELATRETISPWRKEILVSLLALSADNNGMPRGRYYGVTTLYSKRAVTTFGIEIGKVG